MFRASSLVGRCKCCGEGLECRTERVSCSGPSVQTVGNGIEFDLTVDREAGVFGEGGFKGCSATGGLMTGAWRSARWDKGGIQSNVQRRNGPSLHHFPYRASPTTRQVPSSSIQRSCRPAICQSCLHRYLLDRGELNTVLDSVAAETLVDDASVLSYEAKLNSAQHQHFKSQDEANDPFGS
jgi:hypothetical protein